MTNYKKGLLITVVGVLFVTPDSLFVRLIDSDAMTIAFWRSTISGALIICFLLITEGLSCFKNILIMGKLGWIYCFLIGSTSPAFVIAVNNTSVANVVFIFSAIPAFAAILSWMFLREYISKKIRWTIFFVILGLTVISYGSAENEVSHWSGNAVALYISFAYAAGLTILRRLKNISMIPAIPIGYLGSALIIWPSINPLTSIDDAYGLYIAHGFCIAVATACLSLGPRYLSSPEVSLLILLEAVFAPLLVWAVISEDPGHWTLLGGAIVIGSIFLSNMQAFVRPRKKNLMQ